MMIRQQFPKAGTGCHVNAFFAGQAAEQLINLKAWLQKRADGSAGQRRGAA